MKKFYTKYFLALILLLAGINSQVEASHAMGADLTYNCLGGNQYRIRLSFYRDCAGITPSATFTCTIGSVTCAQNLSLTLNLLAGWPIEVSPLCPAQMANSTCNGGALPGVTQYIYEGTITLPMACADWLFSITEGNRNNTITTLVNPSFLWLRVEARLNNLGGICNNSPDFTTLPVPYLCLGQPYIYNHGAVDVDGDSLVYSLVNAQDIGGASVPYQGGFSGLSPMTSVPPVSINSVNGNVSITPTAIQVAVVAVRVDEYRNGVWIGSVVRDIQVTVLNCTNNTPAIASVNSVVGGVQTGPFAIQICPGTPLSFTIPGTDVDAGQTITWTWNNGIPGGVFTPSSGTSPQNATFSWTPTAADIGLNFLTVTLTDNACPVIGNQTRTINILVLAGTTVGPDLVYCTSAGPAQLNAVGGTTFTWSILSGTPASLSCTNCANPTATPLVPTTYAVLSNLASGCRNRDTVIVTPVPSFALAMSPNQTLCLGGTTAIGVVPAPAGAYTYSWSPSGSLSASNIASPNANPTVTTTYTVTVTSGPGCIMTGSTTVTVSNSVLSTTPSASPTQSCAGSPITLNSNVTSGNCNLYTVANIPFAPVATAGTNIPLTDDQLSGAIPIGFSFNFYCNNYTNAYISSNGFLSFDPAAGAGCCGGQALPNAATPNNLIAAAWDDLYPPGAGSVSYVTVGIAPNRRFVARWTGIPLCCGSAPAVTVQIILNETSNVIEIHSTSITGISPGTQGIENSTGTTGVVVPGRSASAWTATNDAYSFTPAAGLPFTVTWQSPLGTTIGVGNTLPVVPTGPTTYFAVVTNGICSAGGSVIVDYSSVNAGVDQVICPGDNANLAAVYSGPPPPSNCNLYTVSAIAFAPVAIAGHTPLAMSDDDLSAAIPIGFSFTHFCNVYTSLYISSNGFLSFDAGAGAGCCTGQLLPNAGAPNNVIAAEWDDLYPGGGGSVTYSTIGLAPNRRFVATWTNVPFCCGSTPDVSSQIIMYETTNIIEIHTASVNACFGGTQGIENAGGTLGFAVAGRNSANWSATNDAYRFSPQVGTLTYTWSPSTYLSSTTTAATTANSVASTIVYTITVNNGTCVVTDNVTVSTVCALAATLMDFTGQKEGNESHLFWNTASEENLDFFALERSVDNVNFIQLGIVNAVGNSTSPSNYDFVDHQPVTGVNYYRLRMVDETGVEDFSNTVEINFSADGNALVSVYPNPANDVVNFDLSLNHNSEATVEIFNMLGEIMWSGKVSSETGGFYSLPVQLGKFSSGSYLYTVKTTDKTFNGKFEVTR
jgi:Secretion system C-terminal sorting domain